MMGESRQQNAPLTLLVSSKFLVIGRKVPPYREDLASIARDLDRKRTFWIEEGLTGAKILVESFAKSDNLLLIG